MGLIIIGLLCLRSITASAQTDPPESPDEIAARASNFSGSNADWEPVVREFGGVEMVLVPAGCFTMGGTDEQIEAIIEVICDPFVSSCNPDMFTDARPAHQVCFEEPFWMDRYEVSNAQFTTFGGSAREASFSTADVLPRDQIDSFEARDFCALRDARLPTEAEWEYAARGPDSLLFPWGNDLIAENLVYKENSGEQSWPVDSRPAGVSWVGAYTLSGNVWEWVNSWEMPYPYNANDGREDETASDPDAARMLRGGSFESSAQYASPVYRESLWPDITSEDIGFRCARPYLPDDLTAAPESNTPLPTVQHNNEWEPVVQEFDGTIMVSVPAGCFRMGSDFFNDEMPIHEQCFDQPFWIDQTEVTREKYADCVAAGACTGTPMSEHSKRYTQPINRVTWFQAAAFCAWRGARLPTEAEWEYAARGPDSLVYPWGNEYIIENGVFSESSDTIADVGSYPVGASWVGALDMSGNVYEWTSSIYADYLYDPTDGREEPAIKGDYRDRVARGGSYVDSEGHVRAAHRTDFVPHFEDEYLGLRCARSSQ
jgi:formylglycine-generating enzyme required for sulfatase activity